MKTNIGIDAGSIFLKAVLYDIKNGNIMKQFYVRHKGKIIDTAFDAIDYFDLSNDNLINIGVTGIYAETLREFFNFQCIEHIHALISGVQRLNIICKGIIDLGGGSLKWIRLGDDQKFKDFQINSLCAAGTGSFLDEQALRLGIEYTPNSEINFFENPPGIATRCAVFAKTDIIHRQQEGYSRDAMWSGLCKSMVHTIMHTLLKGQSLCEPTVITGGVSLNSVIMKFLKRNLGISMIQIESGHLTGAIGAALLADKSIDYSEFNKKTKRISPNNKIQTKLAKPLTLSKSKFPDFSVPYSYVDKMGNEIRIHISSFNSPEMSFLLGIDIGSTSTKAILSEKSGKVIIDIYRKTLGDPIDATKKIFQSFADIQKNFGVSFKIVSVGTTGSGRKLIGMIIGADKIVNEITAHARGALSINPNIKTIFEIGGQDSKYISIENQEVNDSNLNFVCAAGTGSFIEELANKFNLKISEIGDMVIGLCPPVTSDRCTVFMEQDIQNFINAGIPSNEILASILYSVVKNYLNKVVGNRIISKESILFLGATARNKGLVAAFENILNTEIVVSNYSHVMGAIGASLIAAEEVDANFHSTRFKGFGLALKRIEISRDSCERCENNCRITVASIEDEKEKISWGYMCGKDENEQSKVKIFNKNKFMDLRKNLINKLLTKQIPEKKISEVSNSLSDKKLPAIGIPLSLSLVGYLPLWLSFFKTLGFKIIFSESTDEYIRSNGVALSAGEFCYPVKIAHGHVNNLLLNSNVDYVFLPHVISEQKSSYYQGSPHFCPYIQSFASVAKSSLSQNGLDIKKIVSPVVDFRMENKEVSEFLYKKLNHILDGSNFHFHEILFAWENAKRFQKEFDSHFSENGLSDLNDFLDIESPCIVLFGRPYNLYDSGINISIPAKIAQYGIPVIPFEVFIPDILELKQKYSNIYWNYGRKILGTLFTIKKYPGLYPVYITNFNCGPDSFLLSYAEKILMNGNSDDQRNLLILELDEHGADAGYSTRIEAFLDVIHKKRRMAVKSQKKLEIVNNMSKTDANAVLDNGIGADRLRPLNNSVYTCKTVSVRNKNCEIEKELKKRILFIPPMHSFGSRLIASAFRGFGFNAEALQNETIDDLEIGRRVTRGSECLPAALTIGNLLNTMKTEGLNPHEVAFFMPTAGGPCRFGQYATQQRTILDDIGYKNVFILSPSGENAYQGLPENLRIEMWRAIILSDIIFKAACKTRPYEKNSGDTKRVIELTVKRCEIAFEKRKMSESLLRDIIKEFLNIPLNHLLKPMVGVVGEIYIRSNPFSNENVVESIEKYGGEAWVAPMSEWVLYVTAISKYTGKAKLSFIEKASVALKNKFIFREEKRWYNLTSPLLDERHEPEIEEIIKLGAKYLPYQFEGEAILTLGRSLSFAQTNTKLVINCAPFGCMPGTITSALFQEIAQKSGFKAVTLFYDGSGKHNQIIEIIMNNLIMSSNYNFKNKEKKAVYSKFI